MRTALWTGCALLAFAANSILCRLALRDGSIDPGSFTVLRLASGALVLWPLARSLAAKRDPGSWRSGLALFAYAAAFSFAYLGLTAGTGALLLFGAVQVTMIVAGLWGGERPHPVQWAGFLGAVAGLVVLVAPGITAPPPVASAMMLAAGIAWGVYSLRGRGVADPIAATASNFARSVVPVLLLGLVGIGRLDVTPKGAALAIASGAVTSGMGYVVWYAALRGLTATRAAMAQLAVPAIAAIGGVVLLGESISPRLVAGSAAILGGVGLAVAWRERARTRT